MLAFTALQALKIPEGHTLGKDRRDFSSIAREPDAPAESRTGSIRACGAPQAAVSALRVTQREEGRLISARSRFAGSSVAMGAL